MIVNTAEGILKKHTEKNRNKKSYGGVNCVVWKSFNKQKFFKKSASVQKVPVLV
jgi:hypothetical protein